MTARSKIADSDLAGDGKDIGGNHITVRYGIDGDDVAGIRAFLESQAPFEARLGKTEKFEPSESSDGAAVIQAPVDAPELHRLNTELSKHGNFIKPTFPEYKPHTTIAYVKPEAADKYVGMDATEGKTFTVDEIAISKRDGSQEVVKLKGVKSGAVTSPQGAGDKSTQPTSTPAEKFLYHGSRAARYSPCVLRTCRQN